MMMIIKPLSVYISKKVILPPQIIDSNANLYLCSLSCLLIAQNIDNEIKVFAAWNNHIGASKPQMRTTHIKRKETSEIIKFISEYKY